MFLEEARRIDLDLVDTANHIHSLDYVAVLRLFETIHVQTGF